MTVWLPFSTAVFMKAAVALEAAVLGAEDEERGVMDAEDVCTMTVVTVDDVLEEVVVVVVAA